MSFDISKLDRDKGKVKEGIVIPLGGDSFLRVAYIKNPKAVAKYSSLARNMKTAQQSEELSRELVIDLYAETILLEWGGLSIGDEEVPCPDDPSERIENAKRLLKGEGLFEMVWDIANDESNYLASKVEDAVGN